MKWKGREWYRNEYLKSQHWVEFAKIVRNFWGHKCCLCNKPARDVHHRDYSRLDEELLQDCVLLCRECHDKHHDVNTSLSDSDSSDSDQPTYMWSSEEEKRVYQLFNNQVKLVVGDYEIILKVANNLNNTYQNSYVHIAETMLADTAVYYGWSYEEVKAAPSWNDVCAMIRNPKVTPKQE